MLMHALTKASSYSSYTIYNVYKYKNKNTCILSAKVKIEFFWNILIYNKQMFIFKKFLFLLIQFLYFRCILAILLLNINIDFVYTQASYYNRNDNVAYYNAVRGTVSEDIR